MVNFFLTLITNKSFVTGDDKTAPIIQINKKNKSLFKKNK